MTGEFLTYLTSIIPATHIAFASITLLLAYSIFGLTGFGSSITAIPFLILVLPLHTAVSVMLLFDLVVCTVMNSREWRNIDKIELKRLLPFLLAGALVGLSLLLYAPKKPLFLVLGAFILLIFAWNNFFNRKKYKISPGLAAPLGFCGGIFTTLFGTGGPLYTIYLASRIDDKKVLRSTLGTLIGATAIIRLLMFLATGLLLDPAIYIIAAVLFPSALVGFFFGSRMHEKISSATAKKLVWAILLLGGVSAIVKGL
ncbi:sulfite exporter TauE/SafE family protein [Paralcaligenes sp. KSB-10]|uniref:sulfite exporter TauE/SafE family protein n=1 Tax=Paralcaligenes sp. KSB-10 TaxID=2901142 RepID=UPI001E5CFBFB|nr:sulfite exporter TauE/SafE family protein [Paralcaligenes sp. KSB-10]UHL62932.1 sulfite exporter TauE/SafE family protein [Paralcaligenes sp. KSB-10]